MFDIFSYVPVLKPFGVNRCPVEAQVSDLNGNPNRDTRIEYAIVGSTGILNPTSDRTDFLGKSDTVYTGEPLDGTVIIKARVSSKIPGEDEIENALRRNDTFGRW